MRSHRADYLSLVFAVVFVLIGLVGLSDEIGIDVTNADWLWPIGLIGLGLAVLASTGFGRRRDEPDVEAEVPQLTDDPR